MKSVLLLLLFHPRFFDLLLVIRCLSDASDAPIPLYTRRIGWLLLEQSVLGSWVAPVDFEVMKCILLLFLLLFHPRFSDLLLVIRCLSDASDAPIPLYTRRIGWLLLEQSVLGSWVAPVDFEVMKCILLLFLLISHFDILAIHTRCSLTVLLLLFVYIQQDTSTATFLLTSHRTNGSILSPSFKFQVSSFFSSSDSTLVVGVPWGCLVHCLPRSRLRRFSDSTHLNTFNGIGDRFEGWSTIC